MSYSPCDVQSEHDAEHHVDSVDVVEGDDVHAEVDGQSVVGADAALGVLRSQVILVVACQKKNGISWTYTALIMVFWCQRKTVRLFLKVKISFSV